MQSYAGISLREVLRDRGQHAGHRDLRAADAQFPGIGSGQEFELAQALPHLVEDGHAAFEQRLAIGGELDSLGAAVEQPDAQGMLQVGDGLGDDRVRDCEMRGGLRHAAPFGHGEHDMQVPQPDAAPDAIRPIHVGP